MLSKFLLVTSIVRLYSSNYFSELTNHFDSMNVIVVVHATMIFDMLVLSYLILGPLAASFALRTHALILLAYESYPRRATHRKQLSLHRSRPPQVG